MQSYTEITPPTAVDHAVSLPFLSAKATNLVVARTSLLQIFEPKSIVTEAVKTQVDENSLSLQRTNTSNGDGGFLEGELPLQRTENTTKLVLLREYHLSGTIIGLKAVKLERTKSEGEALLIAFKDAKLSLIEWDPATSNLSTISIHYYEGEELHLTPWTAESGRGHAYLVVDPKSRCAALKFGARQLAILPFRQTEDDLDDEGYDPDLDGPREERQVKEATTDGVGNVFETPYGSSFVLPLTGLDPTLTHAVHLSFLYEYRQPTLGVLSASKASSHSLLHERRDPLTYNVFTLDIEQRESTNILQVTGLPYDLHEVVPLPLPIGGTLLLGHNEIIHVDQGGKATAIAVNEFARKSSSFPMTDHSSLGLKLEGATVQQLGAESLDMLLVLKSGELALISFKMDGRSVSGISIMRVPPEKGGLVVASGATCATLLGRNRIFLGGLDGDSVLLGWAGRSTQLSRKRSHAEMLGGEPDEELDEDGLDDVEDDLYNTDGALSRQVTQTGSTESGMVDKYTFRVHDSLLNLAPMRDITFRIPKEIQKADSGVPTSTEFAVAAGRGKAGSVAVMSTHIVPNVLQASDLKSAQGVWNVYAKKVPPKGLTTDVGDDVEGNLAADADYDQFLIVSKTSDEGTEASSIYEITPEGVQECAKGEFEPGAGATIDAGTLAGGTRIVQVLKGEIRTFDADWGLAQMIPMEDEETGTELKILAASFSDPYLLVLRDDSSAILLKPDTNGDMEEIARGSGVTGKKWLSGCLYKPSQPDASVLACLLSAEGGLSIFDVSNFDEPVWTTEGVNLLPSMITKDFNSRRTAAREAISELLIADLGERDTKSPHLILRTGSEDLVVYRPYHFPENEANEPFTHNLRWHKVCQPRLAVYSDDVEAEPDRLHLLKYLPNVGGYSAVVLAGSSPSFLIKEASTVPRLVPLQSKAVKGISGFHTEQCERGFASLDAEGSLKVCRLPVSTEYGSTGWPTRRISLGEEVDALSYHPDKDLFIVGLSSKAPFKLPEDDYHQEWNKEDISFLPQTDQGSIRMFDANSWAVVDTVPLDPSEIVLCIRAMNLEISEETHKRKSMIAVGTAITKGEDLRTMGRLYIFDVVDVVPELGRPETGRKLKLIAKEENPGAVSAISEIGSQGFLLAAHGQKCIVRGLKEDDTVLPTAFMDVQCYVSVAKSLPGTGLAIIGDIVRGLWLVGYTEDPYRMILFGKTRTNLEVVTAEFMPFDRQLYIAIADGDCNLHMMQFDPDHPKSLSGQRLLHKSTFHVGQLSTSMTLLPRHALGSDATMHSSSIANGEAANSNPDNHHQILVTNQSGSLGLITALDEQTYRRLTALQTYLYNNVDHPCGLNPRAYRAVESEGVGSRGIIDGTMCARGWAELSSRGRAEACGKVGSETWVVRGDAEKIMGGVGFLTNVS